MFYGVVTHLEESDSGCENTIFVQNQAVSENSSVNIGHIEVSARNYF